MINLVDKLKQLLFFQLATIYLRYLIGFAFVFASFVKIKGERFTQIPPTEPVGYFFEAMYSTGFYWQFLGWGQFIAGALLMTQRFATVGAAVFFPIILNVFMITHAIDFGMGTPVITTLMLFGTVYLLLWDYKKYAILFKQDHLIELNLTTTVPNRFMTHPAWTITGSIFVGLTSLLWLFKWKNFFGIWLMLMLAVGTIALVFMLIWRKRNQSNVITHYVKNS